MSEEKLKKNYWGRIASELIQEKRTISLNDFIEIPEHRHFHKIMQILEKQAVIRMIYPKVTEIQFIGLGKDRKAKTRVIAIIIRHCRKRYLMMCHQEHNQITSCINQN